MPYNLVRLELDITGKNPDNKIIDEPHTLTTNQVRSIAVNYGPFYAESVIVRNGATVYVRGSDYQIVELHQEATLKYGKEISSVILILNPSISSPVTVTYQALGGHYCYDDSAIANLYQSVINDNRPVDWVNVIDKPEQYPPTLHRHLVDDLYGFESVVDYLERIKQAITLGQVDVVLEIIKGLLFRYTCKELPKVIPLNKILTYDAFLHFITYKKLINQVSVRYKDCQQYLGDSFSVEIDSTGYPSNQTLYLEFYSSEINKGKLFDNLQYKVTTNNGTQVFRYYLPTMNYIMGVPLYMGIKINPDDQEYTAVTYLANVPPIKTTTLMKQYLLFKDKKTDTPEVMYLEDDELDEKHVYVISKIKSKLNQPSSF